MWLQSQTLWLESYTKNNKHSGSHTGQNKERELRITHRRVRGGGHQVENVFSLPSETELSINTTRQFSIWSPPKIKRLTIRISHENTGRILCDGKHTQGVRLMGHFTKTATIQIMLYLWGSHPPTLFTSLQI